MSEEALKEVFKNTAYFSVQSALNEEVFAEEEFDEYMNEVGPNGQEWFYNEDFDEWFLDTK